jgi:histidine triad (HIT) family protein
MTSDCIFCRITAGEAEASIVLRDEYVLAFMDLRAFSPGHTLVIPTLHIENIFALDDATVAAALIDAVARVSRAVRAAFEPDGISIWQSNGAAAGQEVSHLHFHVVPRYEGDGLLRVYPSHAEQPARSELDEHAARIRAAISER